MFQRNTFEGIIQRGIHYSRLVLRDTATVPVYPSVLSVYIRVIQ
jgi:hypothetical protein